MDEIIRTLRECAALYKANFLGKTLLFIGYKHSNKDTIVVEVEFAKGNFMHLTGIRYAPEVNKSPAMFYNECISGRISGKQITNFKDGNTERKLSVLPAMLASGHLKANMIGTHYGVGVSLHTHTLAGNNMGCMGFVPRDGKGKEPFAPNTVLKEDIRKMTSPTYQIVAVCRKDAKSSSYTERIYTAKDVKWKDIKLPGYVKELFSDVL